MRRVGLTVGDRLPFATSWRAAEDAVAATLLVDSDRVALEVKSGYLKYQSGITGQIEKDALLVHPEQTGINGAVWHFVASGRPGTIGADPRILELLEENGIKYVIHWPCRPTGR